jgi:D-lyxose ketol-isomerase
MMTFLTSKLGLSILFGLGISIAVGLTYWSVRNDAYKDGYAACQAENAAAVAKADREQAKREDAQRKDASTIAKESTAAASVATRDVDEATATTREITHVVYRDPPTTQPVVSGSCVHPLDERVQQRIGEAVESANRP